MTTKKKLIPIAIFLVLGVISLTVGFGLANLFIKFVSGCI